MVYHSMVGKLFCFGKISIPVEISSNLTFCTLPKVKKCFYRKNLQDSSLLE